MGKIRVVMDPEQREQYLKMLLELEGLSYITEDPLASYCPISLTSVPDDLKPILKNRQRLLKDEILRQVDITAYDPGTAPFSPDLDLKTNPDEVYRVDSSKILGARYFTGHNILPSDGKGIESEKAKTFNRVVVIFMDKNIRVSRMQPVRAIYLEYNNFEEQVPDFVDVFTLLKEYEPGMGFNDEFPVLLGFEKRGRKIVDLEEHVYTKFPHLQYRYNGEIDIIRLKEKNPELFYENQRVNVLK